MVRTTAVTELILAIYGGACLIATIAFLAWGWAFGRNDRIRQTVKEAANVPKNAVSARLRLGLGTDISATAVWFDEESMWVELSDGRVLGVPYAWFPRLLNATPRQRQAVEIRRFGLHWDAIDEDISISGLLAGRRGQTGRTPPGETPEQRQRA